MTPHLRLRSGLALLTLSLSSGLFFTAAPSAVAQAISLDVLQRDGFGVVPIKRPQPNTLTVDATINGRKLRLNLDTGWGDEGITLDQDYARTMRVPTEPVKEFGRSASGKEITGVTRGRADQVLLGNVQMAGVPLFFAPLRSIQHEASRRTTGVNGFLGAGFLRTCSAVVDLHNLRLYLRPPGTGKRAMIGPGLKGAGLAEAPFLMRGHNAYVQVEVNGVPGHMILDTGATLAAVDTRLAPKMKTAEFNSRAGVIDAAGVISRTKFAKLRSFKIGDVPVRAPDVRMGTFGFYGASRGEVIGVLGMDILGRNGTIIDFGQQKLYFYPLTQ